MRPGSHVQGFGNPFQRHRCFRPQTLRDPQLAHVAFGALCQLCARPSQLVQFFMQDAARLFFRRFPARCGVVAFRGAGVDVVQEFLAEGFRTQTPAAPERFEFIAVLLRATRFQVLLQLCAPL